MYIMYNVYLNDTRISSTKLWLSSAENECKYQILLLIKIFNLVYVHLGKLQSNTFIERIPNSTFSRPIKWSLMQIQVRSALLCHSSCIEIVSFSLFVFKIFSRQSRFSVGERNNAKFDKLRRTFWSRCGRKQI